METAVIISASTSATMAYTCRGVLREIWISFGCV